MMTYIKYKLINSIKNTLRAMRHFLFYGFIFVKNKCRIKNNSVIRVIPGDVSRLTQPNLCVFAHYDRDGMVENYVLFHLSEIAKNNFEVIFVTTSANLPNIEIEKLKPYCSLIIVRENNGFDFGSFKEGIAQAGDVSKYQKLLIANDSVYGPLNNLACVFQQMDEQGCDLCGVTDSYEIDYHLQSYFVVFNMRSILREDFTAFWSGVLLSNNKRFIVRQYEVGLTKFFLKKKYKTSVFCSFNKLYSDVLTTPVNFNSFLIYQYIDKLKNKLINPMHHCWDLLIDQYRCPFIKVDLIKVHFHTFDNVKNYQANIEKKSSYNIKMISSHISRFNELFSIGVMYEVK